MKKSVLPVSLVASATLSLPAMAGILYSDITYEFNSSNDIYIDFNLDGAYDFRALKYANYYADLVTAAYSDNSYERTSFTQSNDSSGLTVYSQGDNLISRSIFAEGEVIGTEALFTSGLGIASESDFFRSSYSYRFRSSYNCGYKGWYQTCYGDWNPWETSPEYRSSSIGGAINPTGASGIFEGYLGFSLLEDDGLHYGWLDLSVNERGVGSINGFAYNSVANEQIAAGQRVAAQSEINQSQGDANAIPTPATLSLMVLGVVSIVARRRKS
ncbi:hypothetical protein ACFQMB_13065 [Pseudobowmanella zhangzhouensis]|uniref:hypothetical protein n=1 Tax=Pseudobowmanella zhangzhouensis TaxID=1537679 RepID=UPI00360B3AE4